MANNSLFIGQGDVTGPASATDGAIALFDGTTGKLIKVGSASPITVTGITLTGGTVTASAPLITGTETWNNGAVTFIGSTLTFTETASAAGSRYFQILGGASGATDEFYVLKGGDAVLASSIAAGTNPATSGAVRIPNNSLLTARNAANDGNVGMITVDTSNRIKIGNSDPILLSTNSLVLIGGTTSSFPAIKRVAAGIDLRTADDGGYTTLALSNLLVNGVLALSATQPTFTSGFGGATGRTITGTSTSFSIVVGSSTTDNNGVLGMPTATNGWVVRATNQTAPANLVQQSASSTSSVTLTQYNTTLGSATNFASGDVIKCVATAY